MIIKSNSNKIRYTGRWNVGENSVTSTANGNYFEFMYLGECAVMEFDISDLKAPYPHLYISVDGGANVEVSLDKFIRISAEYGEHRVCVIMKGSVESFERWHSPLESAVLFVGVEADALLDLPEDTRPVIEFIGDSITEGISIDVGYSNYGDTRDMVYWDDSTAGYAWRTAKALGFKPVTMGYGSLGTTKAGAGNVIPASESYKYYSDGQPMESKQADYIVINHGTNDRGADKGFFKEKYFELLCVVRERNPKSKIISLTPFSGCLAGEIKEVVKKYNAEKGDHIFYIDSTGWIAPEPIHPLRDGHKTVSENITKILKNML